MQNFNYMQGCGNYGYMQQQRNEYYFVDGIEGARAFQCNRPNAMILLMDSTLPMCYKKQTDMYGKTISLEVFDLIPHQEKPQTEYVTKEEFNSKFTSLEELMKREG